MIAEVDTQSVEICCKDLMHLSPESLSQGDDAHSGWMNQCQDKLEETWTC